MHCILVSLFLATSAPTAVDTLVVCPEPLRPALQPWLDYRRRQGHIIAVLPAEGSPDEVREHIRTVAHGQSVSSLLIVGDADARMKSDEEVRRRSAATFYESSRVVVHYGSEPTIASDHRYGDLDGDELPEVAVGRLPVDSPEELTRIVHKIIAYEQSADRDGWRRRIHFVAGSSGLGTLADAAIESTTRTLLRDHIPPGYTTTMTYANWQSPYCPDPVEFRGTAVDRFNEGGLFWAYLGHGHVRLVDFLHVPGGRHPVFDVHAMSRLRRGDSSPIALFFACYTGAFDARQDCLAEEMLKAEGGPVAVVAATRVTMPYAMSVLGLEMMDQYFVEREATIGGLLMQAKRHSVSRPRDDARSKTLDGMARLLNPLGPDLADERREHLRLFHLLGDPLLRLPCADEARIESADRVEAGQWLEVSGGADFDGPAEIDLAVPRDRLPFDPPERLQYVQTDAARAEFQQVYDRANEQRVSRQEVRVENGRFHARLWIPANAQGECHLRVHVAGGQRTALGAKKVDVAPARVAGVK